MDTRLNGSPLRRAIKQSVAVGATAFLLASCSDSTALSGEEPPINVRSISGSGQIELPVARYAESAEDQNAFFAAVNVAQSRCAEQFGVVSTMPVASQPTSIELDSVRRYGLVNADEVERFGYTLPPSGEQLADDKAFGWNPDALEAEVMTGTTPDGEPSTLTAPDGTPVPEGGCAAEGFRTIWGDSTPPQGNSLVETILGDAWGQTMSDSRALAAAAEWSECMAKRGYDFKHRWDAGNSVGHKSQEAQLTMAKADVACALKTNYVGVWHAVDVAYQERLMDDSEGQLEAGLKERRDIMVRVQEMLRAGR